jgi:hypothetical protein
LLSVMDEAVEGTDGAVGAHLTIGTLLCNSIISSPSHSNVKVWARLLNQVRVNTTVDLEPFAALVKQALSCVAEPTALTALAKFSKALLEVMEGDDDAANKRRKGEDDEDDEDEDEGEATAAVDAKLQVWVVGTESMQAWDSVLL